MKLINNILSHINFSKDYYIIGIDGATATGKTFLAKNIAKKLQSQSIPYFIYQLDWTLKERHLREQEINHFIKYNSNFEYELALHSQMSNAISFLNNFINNTKIGETIFISELYSREKEGKCIGTESFVKKQNMIIIIEGHYSHIKEINDLIDYNLVLIADPYELLKRKINRTKSYRNEKIVEDYFWHIDMPSFQHYINYNHLNFYNIIDNTDFNQPEFVTRTELNDFAIFKNKYSFDKNDITTCCFSHSELKNYETETIINNIIEKSYTFDHEISKLYGLAEDKRQKPFSQLLMEIFKGYKITYSNFNNLYSLNIIEYFFAFDVKENFFLIWANEHKIRYVLLSQITHKIFEIERVFGDFETNYKNCEKKHNEINLSFSIKKNIIVPNKIFINNDAITNKYNVTFSNLNNPILFIESLLKSEFELIYRFDNTEELDFWTTIFHYLNYNIKYRENYVYVFKNKYKNDKPNYFDSNLFKSSRNISHKKCNSVVFENFISSCGLKLHDGHIVGSIYETSFLKNNYDYFTNEEQNKIWNWLLRQYYDKQIFNNINISLLYNNLPSQLTDYYFALSISKQSAIPFFTVYDLRNNSLDINYYFNSLFNKQIAFGIQASQNALNKNSGYLKLSSSDLFVEQIETILINNLQDKSTNLVSLWGLGIDHIMISDNIEANSTKEFITEVLSKGLISALCLDISKLINSNKYNLTIIEEMLSTYLPLIPDNVDIEIVIGTISGDIQVYSFEDIAKTIEKVLSKNHRTSCLYILSPSLGTTHHAKSQKLEPKLSNLIYEQTKKYSCITNVLHGTSFVTPSELSDFVQNNCLRINFAGKYLQVFIENLPDRLKENFGYNLFDWKTAFYKEKHNLDLLSQEEKQKITTAFDKTNKQHIQTLNCHQLSKEEILFFKKPILRLSNTLKNQIFNDSFTKTISNNKKEYKSVFLASMLEVPDCEFINNMAKIVYNAGIKHFHIDVGDGIFISRKISGINKIVFLKSNFNDICIHVHLMIDIFSSDKKEIYQIIEDYCKLEVSILYIHVRNSFNKQSYLQQIINHIRSFKVTPGIAIEKNDDDVKNNFFFLKNLGITNILLLGVDVGRGGQVFSYNTIKKLVFFRKFALEHNYSLQIEIDGGLTENTARACSLEGADFLSGWSLFLNNNDTIANNINMIIKHSLHKT